MEGSEINAADCQGHREKNRDLHKKGQHKCTSQSWLQI